MKAGIVMLTQLGVLPALIAALSLAGWAAPAVADPFVGPPICSSTGTAISGLHRNLTIRGNAYVAKGTTLIVVGHLRIAPRACLDAFTLGTVHVWGNVSVGRGATFALGCTPEALPPPSPCGHTTTADTVDGNINADRPLTLILDGDLIYGRVFSWGGDDPTLGNPALSFVVKDNHIGRDLILMHWRGAWIGALRNTIGGNAVIFGNVGTRPSAAGLPDSTEIGGNTVAGNLICLYNTPPAQIGDSHAALNTVYGRKIGECAHL